MGPLELADFMGLDVVLAIMNVLYDGLADSKYRPCPLLVKYVEAGWLGRKSGAASTTIPARTGADPMMIPTLEKPEDFPGQQRVAWRRDPQRIVLAALAGRPVAAAGHHPDRLAAPQLDARSGDGLAPGGLVIALGLLAVPAMLWLLAREPAT
jgi:hypothetical protein